MKLGMSEVEYVSALAKLRYTEAEQIDRIAQNLSSVLEYFELLDELDTEGVEPLTQVLETRNAMRDDEVGETMNIEDVLANAPDKEGRDFVLPKIL